MKLQEKCKKHLSNLAEYLVIEEQNRLRNTPHVSPEDVEAMKRLPDDAIIAEMLRRGLIRID